MRKRETYENLLSLCGSTEKKIDLSGTLSKGQ